jgi:hypothetical protein
VSASALETFSPISLATAAAFNSVPEGPVDVLSGSNSEARVHSWEVSFALKNGRGQPSLLGPKSAISRHRAHGRAELRWNADTFAEMHRSIAVAACEE